MKIMHTICCTLTLVIFSLQNLGAVEPDSSLFAEEAAIRGEKYKAMADQLAVKIGAAVEEKEKQGLQLQQELLTKLEELPDRPENPSVDMRSGAPAPGTTLSWQDFQQVVDRYTKVLTEARVAQKNLEKTEEEQQALYNKLLAMGEEDGGQEILQLQYAYQVRKNGHQSHIAEQLKQALQEARERYPAILEQVSIDPKMVERQSDIAEDAARNLQQLVDQTTVTAPKNDVLIEQQESEVAGYLGRELSDSEKKVMHFEMLRLLELQVNRLGDESGVVVAQVTLFEEQLKALWYQLLGEEPDFFALKDREGDITRQLDQTKKQIKNLHAGIYGYEKELSTLRGGNALTGPKAKELILALEENIRRIFTQVSGAGQRAELLDIQGRLLEKGIDLKQSALGSVVTKTKEATHNLLESSLAVLRYPLISYSGMHVSLLLLLQVVGLLLLGVVSNRLFGFAVLRMGRKNNWSERTVHLVQAGGKYPLILIVALILLSIVGINTSSLALVAGALSLGIGFGMQTIVNNLVSGIILLFDKSIRPGDFISLDENAHPGGFRGNVAQMNIRATVLRTNDNINIIIPNADLMASRVVNWTYSDERVRFRVPFSVACGTDIRHLKTIISDALMRLPIVLSEPEPQIWMTEHGEGSLAFIAAIWVEGQSARQPSQTMDGALTVIYQTLLAHDIKIPRPHVDVQLRGGDSPSRELRSIQAMMEELAHSTGSPSPPAMACPP